LPENARLLTPCCCPRNRAELSDVLCAAPGRAPRERQFPAHTRNWAWEVRRLVDEDFPQARSITLVCDNLNTHPKASLYEAFEPAEAHRLAGKLNIVYTPRNGRWLNVAEIELSVLSEQCLDRRIATAQDLNRELAAWNNDRNNQAGKVN